ncbi:MAG: hypothetical protein OXH89_02385, partial [bacterium]|nr:hypothetical protein [bacterium]
RAVSICVAGAGARVAAIDRDEPGLRSTLSELPGDSHLPVVFDLFDTSAIPHLVASAVEGLGEGVGRLGRVHAMSVRLLSRVPWSVCGVAVGCGAASGVYGKDC